VVYSDCYTLVLGGITGPAADAPLNNVKLYITGNTGSNVTQAPFEIDIYSVAVVGVDRTTWLADVQQRTDLVSRIFSFFLFDWFCFGLCGLMLVVCNAGFLENDICSLTIVAGNR
jgi:hypothetical protein